MFYHQLHSPSLSQSSSLQSPKHQAFYYPQTSFLPSSEPTCSLSEFPESRKHRTGVLDHHPRVSKTQAEQGTISCFVHLDSHPHRHNCLSPWSYCIIPPTQNALRVGGFPIHATTPLPLSEDFLNHHGLKLSLCRTSQSSLTEFINQPISRKCP